MNDPPTPPAPRTSPRRPDRLRAAAVALALLAAVGLPLTWFLASTWLEMGRGLEISAVIVSAWVWLIAMLGLALLAWARRLPPAQQVNARLGHVVFRLLLTAGGLILYLLTLAPDDRAGVGFFGLGWYALTWLADLAVLRQPAPVASDSFGGRPVPFDPAPGAHESRRPGGTQAER